MTEPRDTSVPQAVDRVMGQLRNDDTQGALKQIHDEMNKPGAQPEANKQFLTALTQQCQEQGYLPKLAVDFGKKNFSALDLDGNGSLSAKELQHVVNDPKMQASLDPFEREMTAYLLANTKEIAQSTPTAWGGYADEITGSKLDGYVAKADTKYDAYVNAQSVLKQFGSKEKFDAVDSDHDGFISAAEMDKQIDFDNRALATPGLVTKEAAKALQEQREALEFMKGHQSEIASAVNDTTFSNSVSLADINKHAENNTNPRSLEHIPAIDDKLVAAPEKKGLVDMSRGSYMAEVMIKYLADHRAELDLDGNGKISLPELNKILDTPAWKNTLSNDQRRVIEEMRNRFDEVAGAPAGWGGSKEISLNSMAEYLRKQEAAREDEKQSTAAAKFVAENFNAIDSDKNGWISKDELDKTKDFYAKAMATGLIPAEAKAKLAENLAALEYLDKNKSKISSATWSSDMKQADVEKYANDRKGKLDDIFRPTEVEAKPKIEEKKPIAKQVEVKPEVVEKKPMVKEGPVDQPKKPAELLPKMTINDPHTKKPEGVVCHDGICELPKKPGVESPAEFAPLFPHLTPGPSHPGPKTHDKTAPLDPNPKIGEINPDAGIPHLLDKPTKLKPLIDPSQLEKRPIEPVHETKKPEESRKRTDADLATETVQPKENKLEKTETKTKKDAFGEYVDKYFKYTQENYADALKAATEQGKPVVLVIAPSRDGNAVQAGAQASVDGKAIVVYVDKDKVDPKSSLGLYAASVLENHNKTNRTNDQSMTTVFNVNKDTAGKYVPEQAQYADYGNQANINALLKEQVDATIATRAVKPIELPIPVTETVRPVEQQRTITQDSACNNNVRNFQQYYQQNYQPQPRRRFFRR